MKKNKTGTIAILIVLMQALSIFPVNTFASDNKPKRFCTMDNAVNQLLNVARISENLQKEFAVRNIASDIIEEKLAESPGEFVKIEWKDVYDLRGTINAWLAQNGHPLNRIGQALDAIGSGLHGTILGKLTMVSGLVLAGPPGFILLGSMNATQETFQCNPSGVVMAVNAGVTITVLVPWCKMPGISKGCVSLANGIGRGIEKIASSMFGKEITGTFLKETTGGVVIALKIKTQDAIVTGNEVFNHIHGKNLRNPNFDLAEPTSYAIIPEQTINLDAMRNEINWN